MAREHIRAFQSLPGVHIVGITSRTRSRAEALAVEFGIPLVCDSTRELYERIQPRLVVVTVSAETMCAVACECCAFGWDLLLEKPVGLSVAEAEAVLAAARKFSRKVWVGLNRRFFSSTRAALYDLKERPGPRHIQVLDQLDPDLTATFGHPRTVMDNLMYFSSIHVIDYFRVFGRGAIVDVQPVFPWNAEKPWLVSAALRFASGDTGLYQAVWAAPGPWALAVNTPAIRWEMRPLEQASYQVFGKRSRTDLEMSEADRNFKPGFALQAQQVMEASLGRPSDAPDLDEAVETMRLVDAIYAGVKSSTDGTKVLTGVGR